MPASTSDRIEKFEQMVTRFPTSEVPRYSLATAYVDAGRLEDAARTFGEVTTLRPDFLMAWVGQARTLVQLERFAEARPLAVEARRLAIAQGHSEPRSESEALLDEIERELGA